MSGAGARISAAILAGGASSRMGGVAKAFVVVHGERVIDRQLAALAPLAVEVLIGANDPAPFAGLGRRIVPDAAPGGGPLAGLCAVLEAAGAPAVLVVACDLPLIATVPLSRLVSWPAHGADVIVPVSRRGPEPLCAVYRASALAVVRDRLAAGQLKLLDLLLDRRLVVALAPAAELGGEAFLTNCNTPADFASI